MPRVRTGVTPFLAAGVLAGLPFTATAQDPDIEYEITEYTIGTTEGVTSSSYDFHPQVNVEPATPYPKVVPVMKLGDPNETPEDRDFLPRDRKAPAKKGMGFEGTSQTPWSPPDPTIAVGPNHVVMTVNMNIAWWDRNGNLEFSQRLDDSGSPGFFEDVGGGNFTFDPKCVYNEHINRYFVLALEVYSSTAWITFAISDDDDPNGTWHKYRTDAVFPVGGNTYWWDYPGLGYDDEAFYVTGNLFGLSAGGFAGAGFRLIAIDSNLLSGGPVTYFDLRDGGAASVQVANTHGTALRTYCVSTSGSSSIRIHSINSPTTSPSLSTTTVSVSNFSSPPGAPNLGAGGTLDTLDARMVNADFYGGALVTGHGVAQGSRAVARWYEFDTGTWPISGGVSLSQEGELDLGSGQFTWFPALAINQNGEIGLVAAQSSATQYASIVYARNTPTDPAGSMNNLRTMATGSAGTSGRWGDYFDCQLDPNDAETFWGTGEIADGGGWTTWIACLDFEFPSTGYLYATRKNGSLGGLSWQRGDVLSYDAGSGDVAMVIDRSDLVPTNTMVDALHMLDDGSFLMSFKDPVSVPGLIGGPNGDQVANEDIVQFMPTTLGENTTGTMTFYFDGSDMGLATEDLDALSVDADGDLLMSFRGPWDLGGGFDGRDEDVLEFVVTTLGANTTGTLGWYLNGNDTDVRLGTKGEDIDGLHVDLLGDIHVTTAGNYQVPTNISGDKRDVIIFTPTVLGFDPDGSWAFSFDLDPVAPANNINALYVIE